MESFRNTIPLTVVVVPVTSVYLDVDRGGRVEEIYAEGGKFINKGDPILRFSNPSLQQQLITSETGLLENLDTYQNTQLNLAQQKTTREEGLAAVETHAERSGKKV